MNDRKVIPISYQYLLFDADGTLFNYDLAEKKALTGALEHVGLPWSDAVHALYQKINRQVWLDYELGLLDKQTLQVKRFEDLFQELNRQADPQVFSRIYLDKLSQCADLYPGAARLLARLSADYHLSIVTNGIAEVQHPRLQKSDLLPYIKAVFVSEEVGYQKPDPAFFSYIFDRLAIRHKSQSIIIGDSLTADIMGGQNAGIDTCWYNPQGIENMTDVKPTYEIASYDQLLELLSDR